MTEVCWSQLELEQCIGMLMANMTMLPMYHNG